MAQTMDSFPRPADRDKPRRHLAGSRSVTPLLLDPADYGPGYERDMPPGILPELAKPHGRPAARKIPKG